LNAFYRVGMLSTELEYLCTGFECVLQSWSWNAFHRVGMLATGLECFLQCRNAFDRVGIPLYWVRMRSTELENIQESFNALDSVGMLGTDVECFRQC
jgi:hypothetical protein